jgi:hypothetical protein
VENEGANFQTIHILKTSLFNEITVQLFWCDYIILKMVKITFKIKSIYHIRYTFQSNNNLFHKIFLWQHVSTLLSHHQAFQKTDPMYIGYIYIYIYIYIYFHRKTDDMHKFSSCILLFGK